MNELNYSYSQKAANWWANKIREEMGDHIPKLASFEEILEKKIRLLNSKNGSLTISTYRTRNELLDDAASASSLPVDIPKGYEMKIIIDSIVVYNSHGFLVYSS